MREEGRSIIVLRGRLERGGPGLARCLPVTRPGPGIRRPRRSGRLFKLPGHHDTDRDSDIRFRERDSESLGQGRAAWGGMGVSVLVENSSWTVRRFRVINRRVRVGLGPFSRPRSRALRRRGRPLTAGDAAAKAAAAPGGPVALTGSPNNRRRHPGDSERRTGRRGGGGGGDSGGGGEHSARRGGLLSGDRVTDRNGRGGRPEPSPARPVASGRTQ